MMVMRITRLRVRIPILVSRENGRGIERGRGRRREMVRERELRRGIERKGGVLCTVLTLHCTHSSTLNLA